MLFQDQGQSLVKLFRRFPDTITIILIIQVVFILMTWIIPAGEFERAMQNGREVVVPGSYVSVESSPQGLWAFLKAPMRGFTSAAQIIAFVFMVGGAFAIVNRTGAINAGLFRIIRLSIDKPKYKKWVIPFVMILFSLGGATFGMSEEVLVFILITIPLALALGYDSIVGVAIPFIGAGAGFAGAFANPFTVGIAQGIAEISPLFSGWEYRLVVWVIFTLAAIAFVSWYASRIEKNPEKSLVYDIDQTRERSINTDGDEEMKLTTSRKLILFSLLFAVGLLVFGVNKWGWYIDEIAGLFIGLSIVAALIYRLPIGESVNAFVVGAKEMVLAALVIGMSKGLLIIAMDGKIIDTMLNWIAKGAEGLPKVVSLEVMFLFQTVLNFFVPSGSGQAALTMPIMAPLSDLLEVSRQSAVLAFQLGDGLSNLIIPTSGVTMGILTIAKIPYEKWVKWIMPLMIIFLILAMLVLVPPVLFFEW